MKRKEGYMLLLAILLFINLNGLYNVNILFFFKQMTGLHDAPSLPNPCSVKETLKNRSQFIQMIKAKRMPLLSDSLQT